MCMSKKKENKRRVVKYTLIIFLSVFIYYKCPYRYYTTYFTDYYQVVMKDGEADYMNYLTLLKANGKPNKIWEEQLSKNLVVRYMKYDDGRIFVFDIKKQPYRFCRVEITNPEYRFGRKNIGIGTSKKKIEKVYKKSYRGLHQDELRKHKYLVEDGNREIVFYFNEDYKVNKIVIGDAEIYHGTQGWKRKKK